VPTAYGIGITQAPKTELICPGEFKRSADVQILLDGYSTAHKTDLAYDEEVFDIVATVIPTGLKKLGALLTVTIPVTGIGIVESLVTIVGVPLGAASTAWPVAEMTQIDANKSTNFFMIESPFYLI